MTIVQLSYIIALDDFRHYVNAANHCFVTQPTLTMQVKKLEDELGVLIFNRNKTPLEPTAIGKEIIKRARRVLREANQIVEMVKQESKKMSGTYKIGIIPTLSPYLLPRFIGLFSEQYPDIHLSIEELQTEQIVQRLKNNQIDIGILVTPLDDSEITETVLFNEPFLLYVSNQHELYLKKEVNEKEIKLEELWILNHGHCFRNQVLNICTQHKQIDRKLNYESGSIETLKKMVEQGLGYTLIPQLSITGLEKDEKMIKPFQEPQPSREVSLVTHQSFANKVLIQKLSEEIIKNIPQELTEKKRTIPIHL